MYNEKLIESVKADYERRQAERAPLEAKWTLNLNFMAGNQHSIIAPNLDIVEVGKRYFWEETETYNHIAPIIESRLAKFTRVNCSVVVRPSSADEKDVESARLSTKIIEATFHDNEFVRLSGLANFWAELTGTAFHKVSWDKEGDGSVKMEVCSPYEIYPDSLSTEEVKDQQSIIRAKAYPVTYIEDVWGVKVKGERLSVVDGENLSFQSGTQKNSLGKERSDYQIVIERYEKPSKAHPDGRLTIVAGDSLLFDGALPYQNGEKGSRRLPFIKQVAFNKPYSFFGQSVIERLIPVQRAYNAVKNRKHEYMSRLSVGVLAVEDGSVDVDSLAEEGLEPGKVITYRQGSTPPLLMSAGSVPQEFRDEEDRLLQEFRSISGVSDGVEINSNAETSISGYALSLLIEQDYNRLSVTTESIRSAVKEIARSVLYLYKSNAESKRLMRLSGENGAVELRAFKGSELQADDVVMESDSTMVETPATRKNMVLELLKAGLLGDENGVISNRNRVKIVEMLGFGNWETARNDDEIHIKKAALENLDLSAQEEIKADENDNHDLHISEHVECIVSGDKTLSDEAKETIRKHIRRHKVLRSLAREVQEA
ncbi:MAG: hypothetical protein IJ033_05235 [Clostridia bacterium]|nr:hypothetical protein [Clostridia bacterium]